MTAKTQRSTGREDAAGAAFAPLNLLAELPRKHMALMTQSAGALLRGAEAMRKVQQQAAHRASARHEQATQRLLGPCDFGELMEIHAELLRLNVQEAAQYWQELATAAFKVQSELAGGTAGTLVDGGAAPTLDSLQKAFAASLGAGATAMGTAH